MVYSREESLKHRVDRIKFFNTIFFVSTFVGVSLADIQNTAYANLGGADIAAVISGMRTIIAKLCNSHQLLRQTLSISCY